MADWGRNPHLRLASSDPILNHIHKQEVGPWQTENRGPDEPVALDSVLQQHRLPRRGP